MVGKERRYSDPSKWQKKSQIDSWLVCINFKTVSLGGVRQVKKKKKTLSHCHP